MALSPFAGDLGNAVWTLVIFVIVVDRPRQVRVGPDPRAAAAARGVHPQVAVGRQARSRRSRSEAEGLRREAAERAGGSIAESSTKRVATPSGFARSSSGRAKAEAETLVANAERQIQLETSRALQQIRQRGRRSVGGDRLEAASAKYLEGRQRKTHRRGPAADRRHAVSLSVRTKTRRKKLRKYPRKLDLPPFVPEKPHITVK